MSSRTGPQDVPAEAGRLAEQQLIAECIAGDRQAQERFYRDHRRQVAANLYRVLGHRRELEDLVQDVFVIAFRGLPRFRGDAKLSTWIYRICINVALGHIRSKTRKPPPILRADPLADGDQVDHDTPARKLEETQIKERVYRAMEKLPPKKRIVLYLHEIEGRSLKEIAYLVDSHPVTVRTRLHYAKRDFYRAIAEDGE